MFVVVAVVIVGVDVVVGVVVAAVDGVGVAVAQRPREKWTAPETSAATAREVVKYKKMTLCHLLVLPLTLRWLCFHFR